MKDLAVVIPNHNGSRTVLSTIESVLAQVLPGTQVLLLDDHSSDESVELVKGRFESVSVYQSPANLGASATRNTGLSLTRSEWVLIIDSDVILQPGSLALMLRESHDSDIVFPKIAYPNGRIMYPVNEAQAAYLLISPVFLLRRDALAGMGSPPFDETYRIYGEDTDFFLRAYLAGLKSNYVPGAGAIHNVRPKLRNREERYFLEVRNSVYGAIKFGGIGQLRRFDHAFKLRNILKVLLCGFLNFDLFDLQARGHRKYGGLLYNAGLVLGSHDRLTERSRLVLMGLALKAFAWNLQRLPETQRRRRNLWLSVSQLQAAQQHASR